MSKHEEKKCPRCKGLFECKQGSILQCECSQIKLCAEEKTYLESGFDDCLCLNCLLEIQKEYPLFKEKAIYKL